MRLIDADALMPNAEYKGKYDCVNAYDIANAPTVDAVPVRHGKWIIMSDSDGIYYCCSLCGEDLPRVIIEFNPQFDLFPRVKSIDMTKYCPHCGAKMDGEE